MPRKKNSEIAETDGRAVEVRNVHKSGQSYSVNIPPQFMKALNLGAKDTVAITVKGGVLIVKKVNQSELFD